MNKNLCELVVNPEIEAEMLEKSSFCEMQECYLEKQYGYLTAIENKREEIREKLEKGINYIRENDNIKYILIYYDIATGKICGTAYKGTYTHPDPDIYGQDVYTRSVDTILNANAEITEHSIANATDKVISRRKQLGYRRIQHYSDISLACIANM